MTVLVDTPTWLFCPADRPDRYGRAIDTAGVAIIDLEDAVPQTSKSRARDALVAAMPSLDPSRVIVRINPPSTPEGAADLTVLRETGLRTVMLPMVCSEEQVTDLEDLEVVALCETASGILAAPKIARADNCVAITWGVEDLALDLSSEPRDESGQFHAATSFARSAVRYAAAAADIPAYDTIWTDLLELRGLASESRDASAQGYAGKLVIHPRQVAPVSEAFRPTEAQVERAQQVIDATAQAAEGVVAIEGKVVDRPVIERSRRVIERARQFNDC